MKGALPADSPPLTLVYLVSPLKNGSAMSGLLIAIDISPSNILLVDPILGIIIRIHGLLSISYLVQPTEVLKT